MIHLPGINHAPDCCVSPILNLETEELHRLFQRFRDGTTGYSVMPQWYSESKSVWQTHSNQFQLRHLLWVPSLNQYGCKLSLGFGSVRNLHNLLMYAYLGIQIGC